MQENEVYTIYTLFNYDVIVRLNIHVGNKNSSNPNTHDCYVGNYILYQWLLQQIPQSSYPVDAKCISHGISLQDQIHYILFNTSSVERLQ